MSEQTNYLAPVVSKTKLQEISKVAKGLAYLQDRAAVWKGFEGIPTKEQLADIKEIKSVSVKIRTETDKKAKELSKPYQDAVDIIRAEGKRIGDEAKAAQDIVDPLIERYKAEEERVRKEKTEAAENKLSERINAIRNLGMAWEPLKLHYVLGPHIISSVAVKADPDERFNGRLLKVVDYVNAENERIANEKEEARMKSIEDAFAAVGEQKSPSAVKDALEDLDRSSKQAGSVGIVNANDLVPSTALPEPLIGTTVSVVDLTPKESEKSVPLSSNPNIVPDLAKKVTEQDNLEKFDKVDTRQVQSGIEQNFDKIQLDSDITKLEHLASKLETYSVPSCTEQRCVTISQQVSIKLSDIADYLREQIKQIK